MDDPVQDQESQGGEATGGLFDSYLNAVPDDARETVASYLKDAEKNVNSRLEQAAQLEKSLGPYKDVDLSGYDPEDLSQLIAWHQQVTASDEAFQAWLREQAEEAGLTPAQEQALETAEQDGELTREEIQQLIQQTAEERLSPVQEQLSALQAEKAVDLEAQAIDQAFAGIQQEFKLELSKDQKAVILDLGMPLAFDKKGEELPMGDSSWVRSGFDRWKEITTAGQKAFVEQKVAQPAGSLTAGGTPAFKPATTFEEANAQLRERMRQ